MDKWKNYMENNGNVTPEKANKTTEKFLKVKKFPDPKRISLLQEVLG